MKKYIIILVLFALSIGTGLAVNADIGDVEAFKQALKKNELIVNKGGIVNLILTKVNISGVLLFA